MADVTLWAVFCNDDLTEGRGREYVKHFCRLEATAKRLAKRGYVQGTDCPVYPVKALVLDGKHVLPMSLINIVEPNADDARAQLVLEARNAALEKAKSLGLTDDEIAAIVKGGSNA
jgi:hypothetical protein